MEDNGCGKCNPTYIVRRKNGRGVVALFFVFENDANSLTAMGAHERPLLN
jgi:hypothetical protein